MKEQLEMIEFCEKIKQFLESQYDDSYQFEVERYIALPNEFAPFNKERVTIKIKYDKLHSRTIVDSNVRHLYQLYKSGYYYPERGEFAWQKELIDMIEGS